MFKIIHEWFFLAWAIVVMTYRGANPLLCIGAIWNAYQQLLVERRAGGDSWLYEYDIPTKEDMV